MLIDLIVMIPEFFRSQYLPVIKNRFGEIHNHSQFYEKLAEKLSRENLKPIAFNDLFDEEPDLKILFGVAVVNRSYDQAKEMLLKDIRRNNEIQLDEKMLIDLLVMMPPGDTDEMLPIIKLKCAHLDGQIGVFAKIIKESSNKIRFPIMIDDLFDVNKSDNVQAIKLMLSGRLINFDETSGSWKKNTMHLLFYAKKSDIESHYLIKNLPVTAKALKENVIDFINKLATLEKKIEIFNKVADPESALNYVLSQKKARFNIFQNKEDAISRQILAEFASQGLYPNAAYSFKK